MIIWQGRGGWVAAIVFLSALAAQISTEKVFQDKQYFHNHAWPLAAAFLFSAAATFLLAKLLNANQGRSVIDKEANAEILMKPSHKLFFIDVSYWPSILAAIGVIVLFTRG